MTHTRSKECSFLGFAFACRDARRSFWMYAPCSTMKIGEVFLTGGLFGDTGLKGARVNYKGVLVPRPKGIPPHEREIRIWRRQDGLHWSQRCLQRERKVDKIIESEDLA